MGVAHDVNGNDVWVWSMMSQWQQLVGVVYDVNGNNVVGVVYDVTVATMLYNYMRCDPLTVPTLVRRVIA